MGNTELSRPPLHDSSQEPQATLWAEGGRLTDPENRLDIGVDIPPGIDAVPMALSCIPIMDQQTGVCVGVLEVLNKESPVVGSVARFTESDITIMRILTTA